MNVFPKAGHLIHAHSLATGEPVLAIVLEADEATGTLVIFTEEFETDTLHLTRVEP